MKICCIRRKLHQFNESNVHIIKFTITERDRILLYLEEGNLQGQIIRKIKICCVLRILQQFNESSADIRKFTIAQRGTIMV